MALRDEAVTLEPREPNLRLCLFHTHDAKTDHVYLNQLPSGLYKNRTALFYSRRTVDQVGGREPVPT